MNSKDFHKYSQMYFAIKQKMINIQISLQYGLSAEDKAFLEIVSDLLKETEKKQK